MDGFQELHSLTNSFPVPLALELGTRPSVRGRALGEAWTVMGSGRGFLEFWVWALAGTSDGSINSWI